MEQQVTNFARFYSILKRVPKIGDDEFFKKEMVYIATGGRTESLKEITRKEYDDLCNLLEKRFPEKRDIYVEQRRKKRSSCLKLLQKIGVDTTSWPAINDYCKSPKIAGKVFAELDIEELQQLSKKLRMILKKKEE
ncbi:MAG: hypothetical protein ACLR16_13535 [Segatella copri]|jgi:hypothetical protein|nr:MAG TPA: Protein of unknown function (DUF1018) [Caudoviricetes sp.]DAW07798.1 MAG TPA: Protein of unknown function (DUF1018) [Caudoviricetes sp.]DAY72622.1 MAG TPA: Protein of unknown function (DUF1018) [Caudoviricetes sp.]